jgi:hypothetical protein
VHGHSDEPDVYMLCEMKKRMITGLTFAVSDHKMNRMISPVVLALCSLSITNPNLKMF